MDITQLAADVAKFLEPFLPYLIAGGTAAAQAAGKKFGETAWKKAEELWGKLKSPKLEETAKDVVKRAEQKRDDPRVRVPLELQLEDVFNGNHTLAKYSQKIISKTTTTAKGKRSVAIGKGVTNSTIITGDKNRVIRAKNYFSIEGNVYAGPAPKNSNQALQIFLRVVAQATSNLPLRGVDVGASDPITAQSRMGLMNVYVGLDTTKQIENKKKDPNKNEREFLEHEKSQPLTALKAASSNRRLVHFGVNKAMVR